MTSAFPCTKLEHDSPSSLCPFLCGSTCCHDVSFSLVSPTQSDYAKYNQNRQASLSQIVLWTREYRHTFLDPNLDLKWDKEIFGFLFGSLISKWTKIFKEKDLMSLTPNTTWLFCFSVVMNSKLSHYVKSSKYMDKISSL